MEKHRKRHRRLGVLSLTLIAIVVGLSFLGESLPSDLLNKLAAPSLSHPFGTDYMGRDLLLLSIIGFRNSFLLALLSQVLPVLLGGLLGAILGFHKGVADEVLFHLFNVVLAFPILLAAIFVSVFLGNGISAVLVVISIFGVIYNGKIVRAEIGQIKNEDFVTALRINGITEAQIFWYHILPRGYYTLLPLIPMLVGHSMVGISSYTFLGLGMGISTPEIGTILKDGLRFVDGAPWLILLPGMLQFGLVLVFSLYSDALEAYLKEGGRRM